MNDRINKKWLFLLGFGFIVLVALDQLTKYFAVLNLKNKNPFVIWDGVLELHYHENAGAAWGTFQGMQIMFYIITTVMCVFILWEIKRLLTNKKFLPFIGVLVLILGGAIGNFIDRVRLQYVVDFIYVKAIDFPIFNLADSYISISVVIVIALTVFYYSEEEFDFIFPLFKKSKKDELS